MTAIPYLTKLKKVTTAALVKDRNPPANRLAPCRSHEPCYQGWCSVFLFLFLCGMAYHKTTYVFPTLFISTLVFSITTRNDSMQFFVVNKCAWQIEYRQNIFCYWRHSMLLSEKFLLIMSGDVVMTLCLYDGGYNPHYSHLSIQRSVSLHFSLKRHANFYTHMQQLANF